MKRNEKRLVKGWLSDVGWNWVYNLINRLAEPVEHSRQARAGGKSSRYHSNNDRRLQRGGESTIRHRSPDSLSRSCYPELGSPVLINLPGVKSPRRLYSRTPGINLPGAERVRWWTDGGCSPYQAFSSVSADRYRRYLVTYPVNKAIRDSFSILYARTRLT